MPAPADQLSLFADAEPLPATDAPSGRRKRAKSGTTPNARQRRVAEAGAAYGLFDLPTDDGASDAARESLSAPEVVQPRFRRGADEEKTEAVPDESGRIPFDPAVWHLRPESGDFIQIRTGEIRQEDDFTFAAPATESAVAIPDEWDLPQEEGPGDA